MTAPKSIYLQMMEAEIPVDAHESDLYVPVTPTTTAILKQHEDAYYSTFVSELDGKPWYDVLGAYDPFWISRLKWVKNKSGPQS